MRLRCKVYPWLVAWLVVFTAGKVVAAPEYIAHRGISGGLPENSIEAIGHSWAIGADAVEIDVRVSEDGVLYLFHDPEIDGVALKELRFDEIQKLDDRIPSLQSVVQDITPTGYYIFDLKESDPRWQGLFANLFQSTGFSPGRVAFQSADAPLLASLKSAFPEARTYLLSKLQRELPFLLPPSGNRLAKQALAHKADAVSIKGRRFISERFIESLKAKGLKVVVWTINDSDRLRFYQAVGVDGIITDTLAADGWYRP